MGVLYQQPRVKKFHTHNINQEDGGKAFLKAEGKKRRASRPSAKIEDVKIGGEPDEEQLIETLIGPAFGGYWGDTDFPRQACLGDRPLGKDLPLGLDSPSREKFGRFLKIILPLKVRPDGLRRGGV